MPEVAVCGAVMREPRKKPVCSRCGRCCVAQGSGFTMMPEDYRRWNVQGRQDILRYIWQCRSPGDCDGKWEVWIDWIDPVTGENLSHCPFLARAGLGKRACAIHDTKPQICEKFWCEGAFGIGRRGVPFRHRAGLTAACDRSA